MAKKGFKWIMLFLSSLYLYHNLNFVATKFTEEYFFARDYFILALICATLAYYLGRDLLGSFDGQPAAQPAKNEPVLEKEPGREMTEPLLFVTMYRGLLDAYFSIRGARIILKNGTGFPDLNFSLLCEKTSDGKNYSIKIFPKNCATEVPYDDENPEHLKLMDRLYKIIHTHGQSPYQYPRSRNTGHVVRLHAGNNRH